MSLMLAVSTLMSKCVCPKSLAGTQRDVPKAPL